MADKKEEAAEIGITVRLSPEDVKKLDEHAERLAAKAGNGVRVTRTNALRNVIARGFADAGRSR